MRAVPRSVLRRVYGPRDAWVHKYDFGHLLVVGGSERYSGSPALNALAALRSGVDLVTVMAPRRAADIVASLKPDLIAVPLEGKFLSRKHVGAVVEESKGKTVTALAIGGGLGRAPETRKAALEILKRASLPMVVDADAIRHVAGHAGILRGKRVVLTPHDNEFHAITGVTLKRGDLKQRVNEVRKWASKLNAVILLKGHVDVISDGEKTSLDKQGSPLLTKGGVGDALAGTCGALLARGVEPFEAACASAWINGRAGCLAAKKFGEGVLASDLIECIPEAIRVR
jgi:NAD(P)H-hydrate epimerase